MKPEDAELTIAGVTIQPVSEQGKARLLAKLYEPWADACPACGAIGLHMCEVSPWRSLKDDRPPIHSYVLVRGPIEKLQLERRTLAFVRGGLGYFGELIGISVHSLLLAGFTEWMKVPE